MAPLAYPSFNLYISVQEIVRFRHAIEDTHLITDTYSYPNTLSFLYSYK